MLYLILIGSLVGFYLLTRSVRSLCGPLLGYELTRLGRRRSGFVMRCGYALTLLVVLFGVYHSWFQPDYSQGLRILFAPLKLPPSQSARFAESFLNEFVLVQFGVVFLLTPVLTSGSIADDRQTGTLSLLLTTHLSAHQIVLSKLFSCLSLMLLVLIAGLPMLAFLQLIGGVAPNHVILAYIITITSTVTLACLSLLCSVISDTSRLAITRTIFHWLIYLCLTALFFPVWRKSVGSSSIPILALGNPVVYWKQLMIPTSTGIANLTGDALVFIGIHLLAQIIMITIAAIQLRKRAFVNQENELTRLTQQGEQSLDPVKEIGEESPIVWREKNWENRLKLDMTVYAIGIPVALWTLLLFQLAISGYIGGYTGPYGQGVNLIILVTAIIYCGAIWLILAIRASGTIVIEKERRTLESLVALPIRIREILRAKFVVCFWKVRFFVVVWIIVTVLATIVGYVHPLSMIFLLLAGVTQFAFVVTVGMTISIRAKTSTNATVTTVLILLFAMGGHLCFKFLVIVMASLVGDERIVTLFVDLQWYGLTAPNTLLTFAEGASVPWDSKQVYACWGTLIYGVVAWLLWSRMESRFKRMVQF